MGRFQVLICIILLFGVSLRAQQGTLSPSPPPTLLASTSQAQPAPLPVPSPQPLPQTCDLTPSLMGCLSDNVWQLNILVPQGLFALQVGATTISYDPTTGCQLVNGSLPSWSPCLTPLPSSSTSTTPPASFWNPPWLQATMLSDRLVIVCFFIFFFLGGVFMTIMCAKIKIGCRAHRRYERVEPENDEPERAVELSTV
jgi:hypothetical protein